MMKPRAAPSPGDMAAEATVSSSQRHAVSARAIGIGLALIPLNVFWVIRLERVMFGPYPSTISLFANVVFLLFILNGINALWRRVSPKSCFTQAEQLTIYTMLAVSTAISGLDGAAILSQIMPHGTWFGAANHWGSWLDAFPSWLVVRDPEAVRAHYLGSTSFYHWQYIRPWLIPCFCWTLFITVLLFVANCINVLVRPQWADREKLSFPIIWLPMEMTDPSRERTSFYRNRVMWAGFAIAAAISLWNGIGFMYPSLPAIQVGVTDFRPMLNTKPWSALDWAPITFYPIVIGLGFLLPLELLFSCWIFYFYWRGQIVLTSAMGWDTTPDFPFQPEQGFGSLMGLFLFYLYTGRKTYARIARNLFSALKNREVGTEDTGEALTERQAATGVLIGFLLLIGFCSAAHVALWVSVSFFLIYLASISVVTRIRAELGAPVHDFHFMGPDAMIPRVFSSAVLKPADMAFYTFSFALTRAHRSDAMPVGLEGLQMAKQKGMEPRRMFAAITAATALSAIATFWAFEHQAYSLGAAAKFNQGTGHAQQAMVRMASWMGGSLHATPNKQAAGAMGFGLAVTLLLAACRLQFNAFPLHPLGFALSSSWAIGICWMPLLIAWVLKALTMRFGGLTAYRRAVPFFLGMVLGDCVLGSIWALLSLLLNTRTYNFFGQ